MYDEFNEAGKPKTSIAKKFDWILKAGLNLLFMPNVTVIYILLTHANLFNVMSLEVFSSMLNSLLINYVAYYLPRDHWICLS